MTQCFQTSACNVVCAVDQIVQRIIEVALEHQKCSRPCNCERDCYHDAAIAELKRDLIGTLRG